MAEKPLRFGIVGAAGRGGSFVRSLQANPQASIAALCDVHADRLAESAAELGIEHTFTEDQALLDSGLIDAVVVGSPMQFHAPQAMLALERDIHVLSEVTAGVTMDECRDLVRAAIRSKACYMMAENCIYRKSNVLVTELARRGLFGEVYYAEGAYIHELKELNERTRWRRRWQTGINACTYPTHSLGPVLQWFPGQRVASLCAIGTGNHYKDPRGDAYEMEDSVTMMCRLTSGALVNIRVDMLSDRPHNQVHYTLQGTDGSYEGTDGHEAEPKVWLRCRSETPAWEPLAALEEEYLPEIWRNPPEAAATAGHGGSDYWEVQDFISAILEERESPIDIHTAMDMTLPALVSQTSLAEGSTWVDVPDSRTWVEGL